MLWQWEVGLSTYQNFQEGQSVRPIQSPISYFQHTCQKRYHTDRWTSKWGVSYIKFASYCLELVGALGLLKCWVFLKLKCWIWVSPGTSTGGIMGNIFRLCHFVVRNFLLCNQQSLYLRVPIQLPNCRNLWLSEELNSKSRTLKCIRFQKCNI